MLLIMSLAATCEKPETPTPIPPDPPTDSTDNPPIIVPPVDTVEAAIIFAEGQSTNLSFEAEGGVQKIYFNSNVDWKATLNDNTIVSWLRWCSISPLSGTDGDIVMDVTIAANDSEQERNELITISADYVSKTVTVTQKEKEPEPVFEAKMELSQKNFQVSQIGGNIEVDLISNVPVEVVMPQVDWVQEVVASKADTSSYFFVVAENTDYDLRETHIIFINNEYNLKDTIFITQDFGKGLFLVTDTFDVNADGGTITATVSANVNYSVEVEQGVDWVGEVSTKGLTNTDHIFQVLKNESYDPRKAIIIFKNTEEKLSDTLVINQACEEMLDISINNFNLDSLGGTIDFEVTSNMDFTATADASWVKKVETKAQFVTSVSFSVEPNDKVATRQATITVKAGSKSETISISQTGVKPFLQLETFDYEVASTGGQVAVEVITNINYDLASNVRWVKLQSNSPLVLVVDPNNNYAQRTGNVQLYNETYGLSQILNITQAENHGISIDHSFVQIDVEGGSFSIDVEANSEYNIIIDESATSWLTRVTTKAFETTTESFIVAENESWSNRSAIITFTTDSGEESAQLTVTQIGKTATLVIQHSNSEYAVPMFSGQKGFGGTIDWGDGRSASYSTSATHSYSAQGSHTVTFDMKLINSFEMNDVVGIELIDFSGLE